MSECAERDHEWQRHESICTYSDGSVQHAFTCERCEENKLTIDGVEITEEQAQELIDKMQAGTLAAVWSMEGRDEKWMLPPIF